MLVAQLIDLLQEMPAHMEVIIDVSRGSDKDFVFTIPEQVDIVQNEIGEEFVFIGAFLEDKNLGLN